MRVPFTELWPWKFIEWMWITPWDRLIETELLLHPDCVLVSSHDGWGAKIRPVFSLSGRTRTTISGLVFEHVRCLPISRQYCCYSFKAQQCFFQAFKNNLGVTKTKYILLHALIYSERATLILAGSLLKTTQKSSGWPDLCMLSSVQKSIDRNAVACMF